MWRKEESWRRDWPSIVTLDSARVHTHTHTHARTHKYQAIHTSYPCSGCMLCPILVQKRDFQIFQEIFHILQRFQRVRKNFIWSVFGMGSDSEVKLGITSLGNSRLSKGNIYFFPLQFSSATLTSKCMLRHSKRGQDCSVPNYGPQSLSFFFFF